MMENKEFEQAYIEVLQADKQERFYFLKEKFSKLDPTKENIAELLNIAIIDQFLAEYNYFASYNLSKTEGKIDFDPEFKQHEQEQREHRYKLVERLRELDIPVPIISLNQYQTMNSCGDLWKQELDYNSNNILLRRLEEEQKAIEFYSFILSFIDLDKTENRDTTTYNIIRSIKADEQAHAKDLRDLAIEKQLI